jgi:hypothetical protein
MDRARYSPVYRQAEITGKGQPDIHSFKQRKANMADHVRMAKSYPGGDQNNNFFIKKGELLLGEKGNRDLYERCFSSYNGLYRGEKSTEALMRKYCFKGVATGDWEFEGENMFGTDPLDHGFGFLRAGSDTIVNNSEQDLYGGDIVVWQFSDIDGGKNTNGQPRRVVDSGLNPWAPQNKEGTPLGKALIQIKPLDPMDFSSQVAGAFALFNVSKTQGGVQNVTMEDFLKPEKDKELSTMQEEAFALREGIAHIVLQGLIAMNGLGGRNIGDVYTQILGNDDLYRRILDVNIPDNRAAINFNRSGAGIGGDRAVNTIHILYGGIFNAAYAKMSRIVGKVMRSSKAGGSVDIMFSHFKCWI